FGHEDIVVAGAGQRAAAEVDTSAERPPDDDVVVLIDGYVGHGLHIGVSETLRPQVFAGRIELCEEDVLLPRAREHAAAEVRRAGRAADRAGDDDVPRPVDGKGAADVRGARETECLAPGRNRDAEGI